jgi:hypothetical protein
VSDTFVSEISRFIDADGLVGTCANPKRWSGGNQLEETALAAVIEVVLNRENADKVFLRSLSDAIGGCQNPDGSFNKNPGRPDQITHDDLLCVAAASRVCGMPWAREIVKWGERTGWVLSNTKDPYWDAEVKPWQHATYLMCASVTPAWYESVLNCLSFARGDRSGVPSSDRIAWITSLAIRGQRPFVDISIDLWRSGAKKRYLSVGDLMVKYYGMSGGDRPFCVYGSLISF